MLLITKLKAFLIPIIFSFVFIPAVYSYAETINYFYDDTGQLTRAEYGDGITIEYSYDSIGNRTEKVITSLYPETQITANPSDPTNNSSASFSFTSDKTNSTFECKLDSGDYELCASPKAYTGLADGSHTFNVKATDALGNTDATPATYTWTVDTTPPDTQITTNPSDPTNNSSASFSFTSDKTNSTFECQLDSGDYELCASPKTYTGLSDGNHTFNVKATDTLGNTDATPATYTWIIDTILPVADFSAVPTTGPAPLTVQFTDMSTNNPTSWNWSFGDGSGSTLQNPSHTYSIVGNYTVSLTASNVIGSDTKTKVNYITVLCPNPVRINGSTPVYFTTLQAAYDVSVNGDIIQSREMSFTENLNINRNVSVTFDGGYDCNYTNNNGKTTVTGTTNITAGTLKIGNFILQ